MICFVKREGYVHFYLCITFFDSSTKIFTLGPHWNRTMLYVIYETINFKEQVEKRFSLICYFFPDERTTFSASGAESLPSGTISHFCSSVVSTSSTLTKFTIKYGINDEECMSWASFAWLCHKTAKDEAQIIRLQDTTDSKFVAVLKQILPDDGSFPHMFPRECFSLCHI